MLLFFRFFLILTWLFSPHLSDKLYIGTFTADVIDELGVFHVTNSRVRNLPRWLMVLLEV